MVLHHTLVNIPVFLLSAVFSLSRAYAGETPVDSTEAPMELNLSDLLNIEVTTTSKRAEKISDAPGVIAVITAKEIKRYGAQSLMDVLQMATSVQPVSSHLFVSNVPSVRGDLLTHTDNHNLILLNGRPMREGIAGGWDFPIFTAFPVELIERIEIVRGPGSVLYGTNAFTGVFNIITKTPEEGFHSNMNAGVEVINSGGGGRLNASYKTGDFSALLAVQGFSEQGWNFKAVTNHPAPPFQGMADSADFGETEVGVSALVNYKDFHFSSYYAYVKNAILGVAPTWSEWATRDAYTEVPARFFANTGYTLHANDKWSIDFNGTFNTIALDIEGAELAHHKDFSMLGEIYANGALVSTDNHSLNLIVGFSGEHRFQPEPDASLMTATGDHHEGFPVDKKYSENHLAGYAQMDYMIFNKIKLIAGAQINKPDKGDVDVVPRFGGIINVTEFFGLKTLYGQAFRSPWPAETRINHPVLLGESDLQPEKIGTFDQQIFFRFSNMEYALTYFRSNYTDMIARINTPDPADGGRQTFTNSSKMMIDGIEFEQKAAPVDNLSLMSSFTYQKNKEEITVCPEVMFKLGIGYDFPFGLTLSLFNTYFGKSMQRAGLWQTLPIRNPAENSVNLVSANVIYKFPVSFPLELQVTGQNLLDNEYDFAEYSKKWQNTFSMYAGRSIYLKFNIGI